MLPIVLLALLQRLEIGNRFLAEILESLEKRVHRKFLAPQPVTIPKLLFPARQGNLRRQRERGSDRAERRERQIRARAIARKERAGRERRQRHGDAARGRGESLRTAERAVRGALIDQRDQAD